MVCLLFLCGFFALSSLNAPPEMTQITTSLQHPVPTLMPSAQCPWAWLKISSRGLASLLLLTVKLVKILKLGKGQTCCRVEGDEARWKNLLPAGFELLPSEPTAQKEGCVFPGVSIVLIMEQSHCVPWKKNQTKHIGLKYMQSISSGNGADLGTYSLLWLTGNCCAESDS